jgi:hypothetical protein
MSIRIVPAILAAAMSVVAGGEGAGRCRDDRAERRGFRDCASGRDPVTDSGTVGFEVPIPTLPDAACTVKLLGIRLSPQMLLYSHPSV